MIFFFDANCLPPKKWFWKTIKVFGNIWSLSLSVRLGKDWEKLCL